MAKRFQTNYDCSSILRGIKEVQLTPYEPVPPALTLNNSAFVFISLTRLSV
jgi:hypothetical protein